MNINFTRKSLFLIVAFSFFAVYPNQPIGIAAENNLYF